MKIENYRQNYFILQAYNSGCGYYKHSSFIDVMNSYTKGNGIGADVFYRTGNGRLSVNLRYDFNMIYGNL